MSRTTRRWILAATALALVGVAAVAWPRSDDRLAEARALVADEERFDTGLGAGDTLARAGGLLLEEARSCRNANGESTRCDARSSASAYAQVLAVHVLHCTAPGRREAQAAMLAYLDVVAATTEDDREHPQPPRLPRCGGRHQR